MGKKGGKKGKIDKALENAEPNLPAIAEEDLAEKNPRKVQNEDPNELPEKPVKSKSILKTMSNVEVERRKSKKSKSLVIDEAKSGLDVTKSKSQGADKKDEVKFDPDDALPIGGDVPVEIEEKKAKGKKGKKEKQEKPEPVEGEEKSEKKGKKGKKVKLETEEAQQTSIDDKEQADASTETAEEGKSKKKGKRGKKEKQEEPVKEKKSKELLRDGSKAIKESESVRSTQRMSKIETTDQTKSAESLDKKKRHKQRTSSVKSRSGSIKDLYRSKARESEGSAIVEISDKRKQSASAARISYSASIVELNAQKRKFSSKISAQSSESSAETAEIDETIEERDKKKKGKKSKKQKKEKKEEEADETEEEKEIKRAEREAEKMAKKAAAKAARKEADAKRRAEKLEKQKAGTPDNVKKRLEDFKKLAKEMGIDEKLLAVEKEEEGPKKKISKKEKAKMTAEMAEKAKLEMEAQAKRMEEVIKKKKEEELLTAIEKDKKETVEQGLRMEQLQMSTTLIQEVIDVNAELTKNEKYLLEWQKYIECGKLPNPATCDQMNTYLHLWELDLEKTGIQDASNRTTDAIKLLNELDELIDTVTPEELHKLDNWKWIRQLFREYQSGSLNVATYRLLRDVEHNLNRINIPTADFNFKDDYVTLCLWLRVMLPIPLPNPRRPPKPRVDINFKEMDISVLFPVVIDCENAAIRAMYLKYDHLSDLSHSFHMPEIPEDYSLNLLAATKKEWRMKLKYKYDNRDKMPSKPVFAHLQENGDTSGQQEENPELKTDDETLKLSEERNIRFEEPEIGPDDEIPLVPFKQLKPTASEHAICLEDELYDNTRSKLQMELPENVINLRKFVILGGVFHLNLLAQPPQPQDFVTMEMTITGLYLPKRLEILPFKVVYTPYIPPEPEPTESTSSIRKLPEEIEEEIKKQEDELDKLISINIKWPQHVIFLELPIVCRWDEEQKHWSNEEIFDVKHNEDKCMLSFRTGVFGIYGLASYRYSNLPFQAYDIKPEIDDSVTVQLTAAILMLEFNIKDGLIAITQLQNSPNMTLQDTVGKYMKLHKLKRMMKEAGIDIFPAFDSFCYIDGCCEKQWAMEQHLYYNMAQISNSFNFAWSRWNLQAGRRKIVLQMRQYAPDNGKQKNHHMLLVTPLKATFIDCTEVSQAFSEKEIESLKFSSDLYHLMKITSGIFVRNKVSRTSKQNIYTLAQFLISIRILSFS